MTKEQIESWREEFRQQFADRGSEHWTELNELCDLAIESPHLRHELADKMSELASNVRVSYCPACQKLREEDKNPAPPPESGHPPEAPGIRVIPPAGEGAATEPATHYTNLLLDNMHLTVRPPMLTAAPAEDALELPEEPPLLKWTDQYDLDLSYPSTRLFKAASDWMDRAFQARDYADSLRRAAEGLKAELSTMNKALLSLGAEHGDWIQRCAALEEELRGVRKDAERYRFLRSKVMTDYGDGWINFRWYDAPMHGGGSLEATLELHRASCDAAIDAARSSGKEKP